MQSPARLMNEVTTADRWQDLLDKCLAGDGSAWGSLFDELQPKLIKIVAMILGPHAQDKDLIDEIAARVWFSLIDRKYQVLRQFDPTIGVRLTTYMTGIVRAAWLQYLRSERRRTKRELYFAAQRQKATAGHHSVENQKHPEFRTWLTKREREYWDHLIGDVEFSGPNSPANIWKLRQRIRDKFLSYLAGAADPVGSQSQSRLPCQQNSVVGK